MDYQSTGIIAQFVLFCRGQGVVLPYDDYRVISGWSKKIKTTEDLDKLLMILEEKLPEFYEKSKKGHHLPGLKGLEKTVLNHLSLLS